MSFIVWLLVVVCVGVVIGGLSYILTRGLREKARLSTFECGFDAFDSSRDAYEISFYIVGILFIVMDVEALFLYPWVSSWWVQGNIGVLGLIDFLVELILCLVLIWSLVVIK